MLSARNTQRPAHTCLCHSERFFHSVEESDVRFISSRLGSNLDDVAAPRNEQHLFTLCAKRHIGPVCKAGVMCLWVCYHYNLKLRASIFTKLGL